MLNKILPFFTLLTIGYITYLFLQNNDIQTSQKQVLTTFGTYEEGEQSSRKNWNLKRLANPKTGKIPPNIRSKELTFIKEMPQDKSSNVIEDLDWIHRGPFNVGGRTRAFAIDMTNENVMLAIGVSGGIWRTEDAGASWTKISDPLGLQGAIALVQDTREGHTDTWYYATGELYGNSAGLGGGFYIGDGIFKSTDGGFTWNSLANTASETPQVFESFFDGSWQLAIDPSNIEQDEIYAATYGRLYRSTDGGNNWNVELTGSSTFSYFTNVAVSQTGVVYATFSSDGGNEGIWRSTNGTDFTNITPPDFPDEYGRIALDISPSNENEVYFLFTTIEGFGKETANFRGDPEWNGLWKYTYLEGEGTGEGGEWTDLSQNLPKGPLKLDDFIAQGGYNLVVKVKPDDSNTVFVGGTNLHRSTDGFTTSDNTTFLGGYDLLSDLPNILVYPNHHPDQHDLVFLPSNPNTVISVNDGGLARMDNVMDDNIIWESLNNGYITTQFYTIAIPQHDTSNIVMGGLQDNGTFFTPSAKVDTTWVMSSSGDGSYLAIPNNADYYITSLQEGRIFKLLLDEKGNQLDLKRIDPIGPDRETDYQFINPFVLDPNDNNILYLPARNKLWMNTDISAIPFDGGIDSISTNWVESPAEFLEEDFFTSIAACSEPAGRLYLGTQAQRLYRVDEVNTDNPIVTDLTWADFPDGYIYQVAIDPRDNDNIFVIFSNYEVYSLFYSTDAGLTFTKAAGNLEQTIDGGGNGPSFRWLSVLPLANDSVSYYLGTSTGLYHTHRIDSTATVWTQVNPEGIGAAIVDMVVTRPLDSLIVVATHGDGVYSANTPADPPPPTTHTPSIVQSDVSLKIYPNPIQSQTTIEFSLEKPTYTKITLTNALGQEIKVLTYQFLEAGNHQKVIHTDYLLKGTYYLTLQTQDGKKTHSFVKI